MWPRKQLDIGLADIVFGLFQVVTRRKRPPVRTIVGEDWVEPEEAIVSLSVRSGLDLLLTALRLPAKSEVLVSAVTIPDMARIIEHHGLVPVPIDVDAHKLQPSIEHMERSITPQTRAILVAHLFGTHVDMGSIVELARHHDLLVIEDCAQAFVGKEYTGHTDSDCVLFSFGPIKTATALGGAVVCVRDAELRSRMADLHESYPTQSRWYYFTKLVKYVAFWLLCKPLNYGLMVRLLRSLGVDYDRALGNAAHSFGANNFFSQIRRQPCTPLLWLLERRISTFDEHSAARLRLRTCRGHELAHSLDAGTVIGDENPSHTFWVLPVRVANRDAVVGALRAAGFDATTRSSLIVVPGTDHQSSDDPPLAPWLGETVFVPGGEQMPDDEWNRLVTILQQVAIGVPARVERERLSLAGVPVSI